jgi:NAD(P)-dependent dehydrogenase (short-subunit alcohol dehydrogenase family)
MDLKLTGKRAVVSGGSKGIGRAIVEALVDEGVVVSFCARTAADVEAAEKALADRGGTVHGSVVDVADAAAVSGWVESAARTMGGLDIVVPNVSALNFTNDEEAWAATFNTDLMHTVRMVNAALPHLEASDAAAIVVISSVSGREIDVVAGSYGTMKAALIHYTQGIAYQLAPKGIRANIVSPGNVYFDGGVWNTIKDNLPDMYAGALALNPTGRMAKPEEIAAAVVFLASPVSSFTMGTNLVVDGALTRGVQF